MKKYLVFYSLLNSIFAFSQKGIDGMVQSERDFAAFALAYSTKEAFIKYADSTGVIFENGEAINAHAFWNNREKRPGMLKWRPRFAEIANSRDFGYTTGPWIFQSQTSADTIIAAGHFFTVWQLNSQGQWKFLVDMGTSNAPIDSTSTLKKLPLIAIRKPKGHDSSIFTVETSFITAYNENPKQAYRKYLSSQSILNREQMSYATTGSDREALIATYTEPVQFTPLGAGIALSGDLGYIYGIARYKEKNQNYLHIWRHENKGWKNCTRTDSALTYT